MSSKTASSVSSPWRPFCARCPARCRAAATIAIVNGNAAGVGFNDPTPAAPVGGNPGITLGEQRLNAFQAAANIWGATLTSTVPIRILATMEPLSCTATSAVLGSAGPTEIWSFTPAFPFANTWYHFALANKFAGIDLDPANAQIRARFNSNLGQPGCLTGSPFYLGLDNNHGTQIDLVTVLLHEFGHGLGFSNVTSGTTGAFLGGLPAVWDHFLLDVTSNKLWVNMTNAERAASALNSRRLVWTGANVTNYVPVVLAAGVPKLTVTAPGSIAGAYEVGAATFGPAAHQPWCHRRTDARGGPTNPAGPGCTAFSAANALAVNGKIALMDRGICAFHRQGEERPECGRHRRDHRGQCRRVPAERPWWRRPHHRNSRGSRVTGGRKHAEGGAAIPIEDALRGLCEPRGKPGGSCGSRLLGTRAPVHSEPLPGRLVGFPLGHDRLSESVDGTEHQRRSDPLGHGAAGLDPAAHVRHRLELTNLLGCQAPASVIGAKSVAHAA